MIMSGEYDKVLPMDIYGEYLIKAIITGDIDRQEALGIYEVSPEDFALAEFRSSPTSNPKVSYMLSVLSSMVLKRSSMFRIRRQRRA